MIYDYFHYTELDKCFYEEKLKDRMPEDILDAHTHINLLEHLKDIPPERIADDWALQSCMHMTAKDAHYYYSVLFPGKNYRNAAFPFPVKEAKLEDNNDYVAKCVQDKSIAYGLMCIKPEYSNEYIREQLTTKPFSGVKPYPDMISGKKGSEIGIFEFLPHEQLLLAEKLGKVVMLHLPRAGRMPDDNNIKELREIRQRYPDLKICIAHMGRCFTPYHFELAIKKLGEDASGFWFDTAAVLNPEVHKVALSLLDHKHILFGTDEPIFLWHGRRTWTKTTYMNLAREDFAWNAHTEGRDKEAEYTFYVYEQINNILTGIEEAGLGEDVKRDIFHDNAVRFYGS